MIDEILRAAKKANGIPDYKSTRPLSSNPPPKQRGNKKWSGTIILIVLLFVLGGYNSDSSDSNSLSKGKRTYVIGYLNKGSSWLDRYDNWNYNTEKVQVEIWGEPPLVMPDGTKLTQIYFLEGECAGEWGYTRENFLLK